MQLLLRTFWFCNPQRKRVTSVLAENYFDNPMVLLARAVLLLATYNTLKYLY